VPVKVAHVRKLALSLPGATEEPHFEKSSFRVGGRIFATVTPDGKHLHAFVDESEARASAAEDPSAFELLWWGKRLAGVRVTLSAAGTAAVARLLTDSWRRKAPRRLVSELDASRPQSEPQKNELN